VVDGARATDASQLRSRVVDVERTARLAARFIAVPIGSLEAERLGQESVAREALALEGADAGESLERELMRYLGVPRDERSVRRRRGDQLEAQALRVMEAQAVAFER
jgi:hypothetical protein